MVNENLNEKDLMEVRLERVVQEHQAALLRYATQILHNADAAQDVVQDVFIRLHQNWEKVRGSTIKGWLFRATHNASVDYIRKEEYRRLFHRRQAEERTEVVQAAKVDEVAERNKLVMQHIDNLKPKERAALILRLQEGLTYVEIAEVIGSTEGYVGRLISKATEKLMRNLKEAGVVK